MKKFLLSMSAFFLAMQTFAQSEQTFNLVTSVDALNTTDKYLVALQPVMVGKVQYGLWAMGEAKESGKGFTGVEITPDITELPETFTTSTALTTVTLEEGDRKSVV